MFVFDSRHDDDAEVQPVPGVPQEREGPHAEAPRQNLYEGLERVDTCEGVSERGSRRRRGRTRSANGGKTREEKRRRRSVKDSRRREGEINIHKTCRASNMLHLFILSPETSLTRRGDN